MGVFSGERARVISWEVGLLVLVEVKDARARVRGLVNEMFRGIWCFLYAHILKSQGWHAVSAA